MLDMLEDFLAYRSIPYARLDGGTTRPRRTLDIKLVSAGSIASHTNNLHVIQFQQEQSRM